MQDAISNVENIHAVLGDKVDLLVELQRRFKPAEAVTFCNGIKDTLPILVEDPIDRRTQMQWPASLIQ
jgi:galactonate dehydratase